MAGIKSIKKLTISLLLPLTLLFTACDVFNFGGDLKAQTDSVLTVNYSFYETDSIDARHEDMDFVIGKTVYSNVFPQYTQDDYLLVGWRFFQYKSQKIAVPTSFTYDSRQMITSMCVEPEAMSLYGVWAPKRYVTFVTNCDTQFETCVVAEGYTITNYKQYLNLTKEKHSFRGWYTDPEFNNPFDFNTAITEDITLYAKWVLQVTLTYHQNDGSGRTDYSTFDEGEVKWIEYFRYAAPAGKGFVGWGNTPDATTPLYYPYEYSEAITADLNLYAIWTDDVVTITYHHNDGKDETIVESVGRGAKFRIGSYTVQNQYDTRIWLENVSSHWTGIGRSIRCYSENPSATSASAEYYNGSRETIDASKDIYCIWDEKIYNVQYSIIDSVTGRQTSFSYEEVAWGAKANGPATEPYISGYRFTGWGTRVYNGYNYTIQEFDFDKVFNEENLGTESEYVQLFAIFVVDNIEQTVFFVSRNADTTRDGSAIHPYATISQAISAINLKNKPNLNYTIALLTDLTENIYISTLYANTLLIKSNYGYTQQMRASISSQPIISSNVSTKITLQKLYFYGLISSCNGAAIYADNGSDIVLKECDFGTNQTSGNGIIYIDNNASVKVDGCSAWSNTSSGNGGFIYDKGNLTLAGDSSYGSWSENYNDIYVYTGKTVTVTNTFSTNSTMFITLPAASYSTSTRVFDFASGLTNINTKFQMNNNSWRIDNNGYLELAP